jgi:hypothetical protein
MNRKSLFVGQNACSIFHRFLAAGLTPAEQSLQLLNPAKLYYAVNENAF